MDSFARYAEHPLTPRLRGHVEAAWSVTVPAGAAPVAHRVLPDGCIDVVLAPGRAPVVAGPATRPILSAMAPGTTVRGLRFRPGGAPAALGIPAEELLDVHVPLEELWGSGPHGEPIDSGAMQALLASRLAATDRLVDAAVAQLTRFPALEIRELASRLGISERQLRRRFHAQVGYGPKRLGRVLRLQRLLEVARARGAVAGAELAFAAGYADQPHMAREARELAGTGVSALLAERGRSVQAATAAGRDA